MRTPRRAIRASVALPLLLTLAASACHKGGMSGEETTTVTPMPGGGIITETYTTQATVLAVDAAKRKLTLQTPDGKKTTFKADTAMVNFPQIKVGDQVNAVVTEQVAIAVWRGGQAPPDAAAGMAVLTPVGAKPGGVAVATEVMTARITGIDAAKHKVTFLFQDGTNKTLKIDKSVDLSQLSAGDNVTVQVTEAAALTVTKQ